MKKEKKVPMLISQNDFCPLSSPSASVALFRRSSRANVLFMKYCWRSSMEFTCCHSNGIGTNSDFHPSAGLSLNPFKLTVGGFDKSIASKM